ncbi:unnamed protein product [Blepharisma stoltei]|uniref:ACB domain-containing protein n=1 Tax=Blepharisma stoltei TaxID=1481888 RepID=A0AAU9JTQ5_9CILI|nr:unnamed protein product [Blepharisma stoltei]
MSLKFAEACAEAKKLTLTQDIQLLIYGLYKQATAGDCNIPPPSSMIDSMKYQSWIMHLGKSKEQAEAEYISIIQASKSQENWGNKVSKFQLEEEEEEAPRDEHQEKVHKLCEAVKNGELDIELLEELGVNVKDSEGLAPLHHAADAENSEIVSQLLKLGADVNLQDNLGMTPLHYAAELNNPEIFTLLISMPGIDLSLQDSDGNTVREIAQSPCCDLLP